MTTLFFVHGWGFDGSVWDAVLARLDGRPAVVADLGFRGKPSLAIVERPLVIGHSMGFAWALENIPRPWAGAVAVNAFPRFVAAEGYPGVPARALELMRQQFVVDPLAVAASFLGRCGEASPDLVGLDVARLSDALAWLADCDQRAALVALDCPLLALAGGRDPVVPEPMSLAGFAEYSLDIIAEGGHLLPLTHPDAVVAAINRVSS